MTETKFNLQAALEALDRCEGPAFATNDSAILRDLRERLAGAYSGVLREEIPGKLVFEPDGAGQRVIVMKVEE